MGPSMLGFFVGSWFTRMPWHNDKFDAMLPDGFTKEGIKKIGGN